MKKRRRFLRQADSQISPVFAAKQDHLQAKRNFDAVYQQMEPEERVKARNLLQQHEEAYHRSRPQLIHANQTIQDAKQTYERALADYQAINTKHTGKEHGSPAGRASLQAITASETGCESCVS
ncbi:hypothetical protein [Brevibacillus thermoruber]|uniref:hypothetical protein n=1 Tax=Brevibacillus thermoruber TaxID=33942 RepID=UPI00054F78D0|nr:hypothetical protein [Brevibacillus thermoruber]